MADGTQRKWDGNLPQGGGIYDRWAKTRNRLANLWDRAEAIVERFFDVYHAGNDDVFPSNLIV